ncbi:MAG: CAP domain-containing protein [Acidimicrobiia bacterium]
MRRICQVALIACLALTCVGALLVRAPAARAAASVVAPDAEADFVARTNALRAERGLEPLVVDVDLRAKARDWAAHMADERQISHSTLADNVHSDWHRLGENVGTGPDVGPIHDALVRSPHHLANLLDPGFRYVGVGVVTAYGTMWVSEVFMELAAAPAPENPAPAPEARPSDANNTNANPAPSAPAPAAVGGPVTASDRAPAPRAGQTLNEPSLDAALARFRTNER